MPLSTAISGALLLVSMVLGTLLLKRLLFGVGLHLAQQIAAKLDRSG